MSPASDMSSVSRIVAASLLVGAVLAGCGSDGSGSNGEQVEVPATDSEVSMDSPDGEMADDSAGPVTGEFDGIWRSDCFESGEFGVPEDDQPDRYSRAALTIDSTAGTYSTSNQLYTDSQCTNEMADLAPLVQAGRIRFEGVTTTSSGLEATVVRYTRSSDGLEIVGLLYREGDVLYRELNPTTLIEDIVPTDLALSSPWRLAD